MHHNGEVPDHPHTVDDAARALYALPPDEFLAKRAELSAQSRAHGDAAGAQSIDKLRKPTAAAWIVNVLALAEPSIVDELIDLGRRLREAQDALDAGRL